MSLVLTSTMLLSLLFLVSCWPTHYYRSTCLTKSYSIAAVFEHQTGNKVFFAYGQTLSGKAHLQAFFIDKDGKMKWLHMVAPGIEVYTDDKQDKFVSIKILTREQVEKWIFKEDASKNNQKRKSVNR